MLLINNTPWIQQNFLGPNLVVKDYFKGRRMLWAKKHYI